MSIFSFACYFCEARELTDSMMGPNISSKLSDQFRSALSSKVLLRACMDCLYIYGWENQISVEATDTEFARGGLRVGLVVILPKIFVSVLV